MQRFLVISVDPEELEFCGDHILAESAEAACEWVDKYRGTCDQEAYSIDELRKQIHTLETATDEELREWMAQFEDEDEDDEEEGGAA